MLMKTALIASVLSLYTGIINTKNDDQYREERSQRGIALLNYTYKSFYSGNYPSCLLACKHESQCMSLNYWWYKSQCDLNVKTEYSAEPRSLICDPSVTYMGMMREPGRGTKYRSCNDVHPSCGDGEYSIDPTSSGDPFTVYCDMTTDGGGWTLVYRVILRTSTPPQSHISASNYRDLSKYKVGTQLFPSTVLLQLRQDMGYQQLRFYCYKKAVGTVFHIMTNRNATDVPRYFTDDAHTKVRPQACSSFTMLPDDNSRLSQSCNKWGGLDTGTDGRWGTPNRKEEYRLYSRPCNVVYKCAFSLFPPKLMCDDQANSRKGLQPFSLGDTWAFYVR